MIKPRAGSRSAFLKVGFGLDGTPLSAPKKPQELLVAGAGSTLGVGDEFGA